MDSPKVLLLTHGGWGIALVDSLKMIMGSVDFVHEIPLTPEVTFEEYYNIVNEYVDTMPENSLILTDIFGGTTTNVAAKIGRDRGLKVISGLNAPLLTEVCSEIVFNGNYDFDAVLTVGKTSVKDVVKDILDSINKRGE